MIRIPSDRSRIESYQHCKRERWLTYHEGGVGIVPAKKALPLALGGAVHVGLAVLVERGQALWSRGSIETPQHWEDIEEAAVVAALADFAGFKSALDIGTEAVSPEDAKAAPPVPAPYDDYLYQEQASLVEAMVRAYARRRLRPLLAEFEVLEVEREGAWQLHAPSGLDANGEGYWGHPDVWFLSRPDALLRHRVDNHLEILSYKTTGAWDVRKARDAEHDMQGLSEGIEVERRLGEWWAVLHGKAERTALWRDLDIATERYLRDLAAPPRILAIRYEYLLKGERWRDKDLAARFGIDWARAQRSHLIRQYVCVSTPSRGANAGAFALGDTCWSYDYHQEDGRSSKLAWQNWNSRLVTESGMTIRDWIDKLDSATLTMAAADSTLGIEPREVGWSCDAQSVGYTAVHPLDAVFLPPMVVYRSDDSLRDLVEQIEAQEVRVAEDVAAVEAARDEDERRSELNKRFPQTRRACCYPVLCDYEKICWGGEDIRRDPLSSGLFKRRECNHPAELEMREASK